MPVTGRSLGPQHLHPEWGCQCSGATLAWGQQHGVLDSTIPCAPPPRGVGEGGPCFLRPHHGRAAGAHQPSPAPSPAPARPWGLPHASGPPGDLLAFVQVWVCAQRFPPLSPRQPAWPRGEVILGVCVRGAVNVRRLCSWQGGVRVSAYEALNTHFAPQGLWFPP